MLRFWKVSFQTVAAPVLTTLLYLLVFSHALANHVQAFPGVTYVQFLVPGLAMMAMLQNAFANSSSSLIQSKITGNIIFILLPPMAAGEIFAAYLLAAMVRGLVVGTGVFAATLWLVPLPVPNVAWLAAFAVVGCGMLGTMGIIAGIWSEKFDQLGGVPELRGDAAHLPRRRLLLDALRCPPFWQAVSKLNPFFYAIDGFRYAFFGQSDVSPWASLAIATGAFAALSWLTLLLLARGYKLRH